MSTESDLLKEYYAIREALADELYQLEEQIPVLLARRDELRKAFGHDLVAVVDEAEAKKPTRKKVASRRVPPETALLRYLELNPDLSRAEINEFFHGLMPADEVGKLIANMSKRKVIQNVGTKRDSRWRIANSTN